jgi:hypothetical protein
MEMVKECPCAVRNPNYPYEGMVTKHNCILGKNKNNNCDQETTEKCKLFEYMQDDEDLKEFIRKKVMSIKIFK